MLDQVGFIHERLHDHDILIRDLLRRVEAVMVGSSIRSDSIDGIIPAANVPVYWWYNGNLLGGGVKVDLRQHSRVWISGTFVAGRAYYDIGTYPDPPWISGVQFSVDGDLACFGARLDLQEEWGVWISGSCIGDQMVYQIGAYSQGGGGGASGTVAFYEHDVLFCEALEVDLEGCDGVWISGSCVEGGSKARYQIGGGGGGGGGAPVDARYVTTAADDDLSAEVVREFLGNFYAETYPAAAATEDDEFDDTAGNSGLVNGLDAKWVWRNQGGATATFTKQGWLTLGLPAQASTNWRIIEQAMPAGNWTLEAKLSFGGLNTNYTHAGIALIDGVNGDFYVFGLMLEVGNALRCEVQRWNSVTSWNANPWYCDMSRILTFIYLRIVKAGASFGYWASADGISWTQYYVLADGVGVTKIGLAINEENNSGMTKAHFDYFRTS